MINADGIRQLYDYHFTINRKLWDHGVLNLTQAQYVQREDYGIGSIRNHVVHLVDVDQSWFLELRGIEKPRGMNAVHYFTRESIRAKWDEVEAMMRSYLNALTDADLNEQPFLKFKRKSPTRTWQALVQVINHGTDHRAQLLMLLNRAGVETFAQDWIFFVLDRL